MRRTIGLIGYSTKDVNKVNAIQQELPYNIRITYVAINNYQDPRGKLFDDASGTTGNRELDQQIFEVLKHCMKDNIGN